jgi:hypothetical protein
MNAIVIQSDTKSLKIISELAKQLGGNVIKLNSEQLEDFTFGEMVKEAKTGKTVTRETIMEKLK